MDSTDEPRQAPRRWARRVGLGVLVALAGAVLAAAAAVATPAHVEIAGSDTRVWIEPGSAVDQVGVTGVVTLKRTTGRSVFGEPVGVRAVLDLNTSELVGDNGALNADVLPAYIGAYSDPKQLVGDIRHELLVHLLLFVCVGAALALAAVGARWGYRSWRASYDRAHFGDGTVRAAARSYRRPERVWTRRLVGALVAAVVLAAIPSAGRHPPVAPQLVGSSIFEGTPLAGVQVSGLLRPALVAARDYVRTYFGQTDEYYSALRDALRAKLDESPVPLPAGDGIAQVGFVTDRHCNTGMDRVVIALLERFGVHTLVSGGDDAFSGTFSFEAACTRNLAQQSAKAGITDVFAAGNHDSAQTVAYEKDQGMTTLDGDVVSVDGLRFIGSPDPRTSRYGKGIQPPSAVEQHALLEKQGTSVGATACSADGPVVAVLHDPQAGTRAIQAGCGKVTLALDGHTHQQTEPADVTLPDGAIGKQFTGGSSGGAPGQGAVDRTFASSLTVGPLNHDAFVNILSIERGTGRLVAVTEFRFTPAQDIEATQNYVP